MLKGQAKIMGRFWTALLVTMLMGADGQTQQAGPVSILPQSIVEAQADINMRAELVRRLESMSRIRLTQSRVLNKVLIDSFVSADIAIAAKQRLLFSRYLWSALAQTDLSLTQPPVKDAPLFVLNGTANCGDPDVRLKMSPRAQMICHAVRKDQVGFEAVQRLYPGLGDEPLTQHAQGVLYDVPVDLLGGSDMYHVALSLMGAKTDEGVRLSEMTAELFADHPDPVVAFEAHRILLERGRIDDAAMVEVLKALPDDHPLGALVQRITREDLREDLVVAAFDRAKSLKVIGSVVLLMKEYLESLEIERVQPSLRRDIYLALFGLGEQTLIERLATRADDTAFVSWLTQSGSSIILNGPFVPPPGFIALQAHIPGEQRSLGLNPSALQLQGKLTPDMYILLQLDRLLGAFANGNHRGVMDVLHEAGLEQEALDYRRDILAMGWDEPARLR